MKIFDTHAHYDDERFDEDRTEILEQILPGSDVVNVTNIGCDMKTSEASVAFSEKYDYIYAAIGVIPHHVEGMTEADIDRLRELAKTHKKVVAIGEIGLDYYYADPDRELQKHWFVRQMELARELSLPLVIHSRESAQDTYQLMKQAHAEEVGGVVHCYSYTDEMAREFMRLGFYFGIGGAVTFKNNKKLKRAVAAIPLERIVLETDSPYLTPTPHRGKRNDSTYLPYVITEIAGLKGVSEEEVAEVTLENAKKLYRLTI